MFRNLFFSKNSSKRLYLLLEYLESKWSIKVREEFEIKFNNCIEIIKSMPESFPKLKNDKIRHKCVVTKQTTVLYKFNSKEIVIIAVFDSRQDPKNIKKV